MLGDPRQIAESVPFNVHRLGLGSAADFEGGHWHSACRGKQDG